MQHLMRSPWQKIQQRRTQRVLDNPTTDQKKKGMLAQKVPIPASLSDLEDGRGAGVTGCHQGGYPGSITFCPHLSYAFFPDSHSTTSCHHLSGRSLLPSLPLLSALMPSYPPHSTQPEVRSRPFSATNLRLPPHPQSQSVQWRLGHVQSALLLLSPSLILLQRHHPGSHQAHSHLKAFALAVPSAGYTLPPDNHLANSLTSLQS